MALLRFIRRGLLATGFGSVSLCGYSYYLDGVIAPISPPVSSRLAQLNPSDPTIPVYRDCYEVMIPRHELTSFKESDLSVEVARAFYHSPVFRLERTFLRLSGKAKHNCTTDEINKC